MPPPYTFGTWHYCVEDETDGYTLEPSRWARGLSCQIENENTFCCSRSKAALALSIPSP